MSINAAPRGLAGAGISQMDDFAHDVQRLFCARLRSSLLGLEAPRRSRENGQIKTLWNKFYLMREACGRNRDIVENASEVIGRLAHAVYSDAPTWRDG